MAAETGKIEIRVDEEALREQMNGVLTGVVRETAMRLRRAADELDGGAWWRELEEHHNRELQRTEKVALERGRAEGRAEAEEAHK